MQYHSTCDIDDELGDERLDALLVEMLNVMHQSHCL
jgi:hypothetical protein